MSSRAVVRTVALLAAALSLAGCTAAAPPLVASDEFGTIEAAVALAGLEAPEWVRLLDELHVEVAALAAVAVDLDRFLDEPTDGTPIERTPDSTLGEVGLRGDAQGLLVDGVAQFTTTMGIAVYDDGPGQRWYHEAVVRVAVCEGGAAELRGRLNLVSIQEFVGHDGTRTEVQAWGAGEPVALAPGTFDLDLRVGFAVVETTADGNVTRSTASTEIVLRDVDSGADGLRDAVAAALASGDVTLDTDDDLLRASAADLLGTLVSFTPAAGPGFERAFLAARMGEGCFPPLVS